MRIHEIISETVPADWDLGGAWITPEGDILMCDHHNNIHHTDLAFSEYGEFIPEIEYDEQGEPDDYYKDLAVEMANDNGWIRVSTNGSRFMSVQWMREPTPNAMKTLAKFIKNGSHFGYYELHAPHTVENYDVFDDVKSFLTGIKRAYMAGKK